MFGRRRRDGFDADRPAMQNNLDLTGYSEQYVLPADGGFSNRPPREAVPETDLFGSGTFGNAKPSAAYGVQQQSNIFGGAQPVSDGMFGGAAQQGFGTAAQSAIGTADPVGASSAVGTERPMVFALRNYKDMYVYEYSDRLEYYCRTENGMEYRNTEYKRR